MSEPNEEHLSPQQLKEIHATFEKHKHELRKMLRKEYHREYNRTYVKQLYHNDDEYADKKRERARMRYYEKKGIQPGQQREYKKKLEG